LRLFSSGGYGLALAALALVIFGAIECSQNFSNIPLEQFGQHWSSPSSILSSLGSLTFWTHIMTAKMIFSSSLFLREVFSRKVLILEAFGKVLYSTSRTWLKLKWKNFSNFFKRINLFGKTILVSIVENVGAGLKNDKQLCLVIYGTGRLTLPYSWAHKLHA